MTAHIHKNGRDHCIRLRLPDELADQIARLADAEGWSDDDMVRWLIRRGIAAARQDYDRDGKLGLGR